MATLARTAQCAQFAQISAKASGGSSSPFLLMIPLARHCVECKAWVDECSAKCVEEEDEQCSDECKKILAEHKARCYEKCTAVA